MLKEFLEINKLKAKIVATSKPIIDVSLTAEEMHISSSNIGKTILFIDEAGFGILCIISASSKINESKIIKLLGIKKLTLASPKKALEITDYEFDAIPPISIYGLKVILDKKLAENKTIYCNAGEKQKLLQISAQEIIENNEDILVEEITN
ncbi:MAG: YbaK/EbsC family protein [archaeon]|nr:YbaK/EbsC family protein [archaeon]